MYRNRRVFVSGGAGVIGTALVSKLLEAGAIVMVGDLKAPPAVWKDSVRYWRGDLNRITYDELSDFAPEYYFHLAATFERSTETYEFWQENDRHNTRLSHHLIDLMKDMPSLRKVIFASSYLIYDPALYQFEEPASSPSALKESDPIRPRNLCGMAKLQHEMELRFLSEFKPNLQTVSARIYRVYGKNSRDIVSRWIQSLLRGETIRVFRKEGRFDYIYAEDVAEGLYRLAMAEYSGVVNLGNGRAREVRELLDLLKAHFPEMEAVDEESDIPFEASEADMTRFYEWTGWRPEHDLENVIPELIAHYRQVRTAEPADAEAANVLVTSLSRKVPLVKCLRQANERLGGRRLIYGADSNPEAIGRHFVDGFWPMPRLDQLPLTELVSYCRKHGIRSIIPTRDGELAYFAAAKPALAEAGIAVMVSSEQTIKRCADKLAFYEYGAEHGFPVIPTAAQYAAEMGDRVVAKPRYGAGARTMALDVSPEDAVRQAERIPEPIYQPYVPGREVSADLYVDQAGRCRGVVLRYREIVIDGESQSTVTFRDESIERLCSDLAEKLGIYGHAVMQLMVDDSGRPHIIECNARFGGASRLSLEAGLDSFRWFLMEGEGQPLDEPFVRLGRERRMIRFPEDVFQ
ncbi:NAD-dependent epimerase/dehydratase family protein [Cohnella hongkongensis]|uniref:NAD-dependent epimerase/dehydratase family protein n=1 Tax=Cohnella hongkongensis TaxID=178337 RepID=A0ABV9FHL1_9BACL